MIVCFILCVLSAVLFGSFWVYSEEVKVVCYKNSNGSYSCNPKKADENIPDSEKYKDDSTTDEDDSSDEKIELKTEFPLREPAWIWVVTFFISAIGMCKAS